jgi:hypothetical protein
VRRLPLTHEIYNAVLPETAHTPMVIEKSESVMHRLKEIADVGFTIGADELYQESDSVLFSKDIANQEVEEVEENIALNTLGTIIHETLKSLYDPLLGDLFQNQIFKTASSKSMMKF